MKNIFSLLSLLTFTFSALAVEEGFTIPSTSYTRDLVGRSTNAVTARGKLNAIPKVDSVAELIAFPPSTNGVMVLGYYSKGDCPSRIFYYDSADSSTDTNRGTVFASSDSKRWKWTPEGWLDVRCFGAKGDGLDASATVNTAAIQAALDTRNYGVEVYVPFGDFRINDSIIIGTSAAQVFAKGIRGQGFRNASALKVSRITMASGVSSRPIVKLYGQACFLENLNLEYADIESSSDTSSACIYAEYGFMSEFKNIECINGAYGLYVPSSGTFFSTTVENLVVKSYSIDGISLNGSGTQAVWINNYVRMQASPESGSGTGVSNVETNTTITGLSSSLVANIDIGQIVIISGLSPSEFNGAFTVVDKPSSTSIKYTLGSAPSGAVSGTPAVDAWGGGPATGYAVRIGNERFDKFINLNIEHAGGPGAIKSAATGQTMIYGLHVEGYKLNTTASAIVEGGNIWIGNMSFLNNTILTNVASHLLKASTVSGLNSRVYVDTLITRDTFIDTGSSLGLVSASGNNNVTIRSVQPATTVRWNRQSTYTSEAGRLAHLSGNTNKFSITDDGTASHFSLDSGSTNIMTVSSLGNVAIKANGSTARTVVLSDVGSITNSKVTFTYGDPSVDRHFQVTGNTINVANNAATAQNLSIQSNGGGTIIGGALKSTPKTISASAIDWTTGWVFTKTLSADTTFTFAGAAAGQTIEVVLTQDPATPRTVTWPTVRWIGGAAPTMTATVSKIDKYTIYYNGSEYLGKYEQNY